MQYEDSTDTAPEAAPDKSTFYLPEEFPGKEALKAGDTITLRVIEPGDEVEVEVIGNEPDGKPMMEDLRTSGAFNEEGV